MRAISASIALVLGTLCAIALVRFRRFRGKTLLAGMVSAPLVMPDVITGLSLLLLFVFALVPPLVRAILGTLSRRPQDLACEPSGRVSSGQTHPRLADMLALGIWVIFAVGLAVAAPPLLTMLGGN